MFDMSDKVDDEKYRKGGFSRAFANKNNKELKKFFFIPLDFFAICENSIELVTDGLNACIGLCIKSNDKTFLAHIPENHKYEAMLSAIRREFGNLDLHNVSIKISFGCWEDETNAIDCIIMLLHKLDLLVPVISNIKNTITYDIGREKLNEALMGSGSNAASQSSFSSSFFNSSQSLMSLDEFMDLESIEDLEQAHNIARFIDSIKHAFSHVSLDSVINKIPYEAYLSSLQAVPLGSNPVSRFNL